MTKSVDFAPLRPPGSATSAGSYNSEHLDMETPWHVHDLHQLIYAFEGAVEVEDDSARYKVPYQFAAWIPAGIQHRTAIARVRSASIFLSPNLAPLESSEVRVIPANGLMREMILHALRWPISEPTNHTSQVFFQCFAELCREWVQEKVELVLPATDNRRIAAVVQYTRDNLPHVKLEEVCLAVGMSARSLRRHFQTTMGISWEEYRLRLRMYAAVEKLDKSNFSISDVAEYIGYGSQQAFSRAFTAFMGMSPKAFRKRKQTAQGD